MTQTNVRIYSYRSRDPLRSSEIGPFHIWYIFLSVRLSICQLTHILDKGFLKQCPRIRNRNPERPHFSALKVCPTTGNALPPYRDWGRPLDAPHPAPIDVLYVIWTETNRTQFIFQFLHVWTEGAGLWNHAHAHGCLFLSHSADQFVCQCITLYFLLVPLPTSSCGNSIGEHTCQCDSRY